mmetsp:Transcript_23514/g.37621  ORF Transcript_23514/g.37621 Transcript_23514/m.37621 type:complete len:183 (-) Transcript_23514:137-685(-)
MVMTRSFQVAVILAMGHGIAAVDPCAVAYNTTEAPAPCGTVAPVTTVTTTPAGSPCGTVAPVVTVTTTPAATYTTTPAATVTTTPRGGAAASSPCAIAPAAKYGGKKMDTETTTSSFIQSFPVTIGLFSLLTAAAAVGMIVRVVRSSNRSQRLTFTGRRLSRNSEENDLLTEDIEANQHFLE